MRFYDFIIINLVMCLLPPTENYFLPSTAIESRSKMPATSKKELFVAIV